MRVIWKKENNLIFVKRKIEYSNKSWFEVMVEGGLSVGKVLVVCWLSIGWYVCWLKGN